MKDGCGIVDSGVPDLGSNEEHLARLAKEIDAEWWSRNCERILKKICVDADA
jgi:hypothetical protein